MFSNWGNTNELRNYPLDDLASKQADGGAELPDDLLADVQLMVPESAGKYVFVASAAVSANLVSITFSATADPIGGAHATIVPICALSVQKPVTLFRNYAIDAIYPGVGGWVMFGGAAVEQHSLSLIFSDPDASILTPKAARYYRMLPVTALGKVSASAQLSGLVRLTSARGLVLEGADMFVDGESRRVISVRTATDINTQNTLKALAGDCGARPDDDTCPKTPLQHINGVYADCDGNIQIDIQGDIPWGPILEDGVQTGLMMQYPLGLVDVCEDTLTLRPRIDLCESSIPSSSPGPAPSSSISSISSISSPSIVCPDIAGDYFEDFSGPTAVCFDERSGDWEIDGGDEYKGSNSTDRGLSLLTGSPSKDRRLETKMGVENGPALRSYFVFCLLDSINFWYIKMDVGSQRVSIGRVKGGLEQDGVYVSEALALDTLYDIKIEVVSTGTDSGEITLWVGGVLRTALSVSSDLYDGECGYGVKQSNGFFDDFRITVI